MRIFIVLLTALFAVPLMPGQSEHVHTSRAGARLLPLPKEEGVWHFVVFGDRTGGQPEGIEVLRQAVADTNLLDPDLVMTVGDLVQGYNATKEWMRQMAEYRSVMDGLRMAWFPVAGNHDIYWRGAGRPPREHEEDFEKHFGPLWYAFRHKNAGFVVLFSDEGDPKTTEKGFREARHTQMSSTQLSWLEETLATLADLDHVFVFLHHPRWVQESYPGTNWDDVHRLLVKAGNVTAVFAGHIHRMRHDGIKDGIEYLTLATTGGDFRDEIPRAGFLHHFDVVTVRKDRISLAAIPVGAVIDPREMTPERLREVDLLLAERAPALKAPLALRPDGSASAELTFTIKNPAPRRLEAMLSFASGKSGLVFSPDHQHVTLQGGASRRVSVRVSRPALEIDERVLDATVRIDRDYLAETARITLPPRDLPIEAHLEGLPELARDAPPGVLALAGGKDCLRVAPDAANVPDGPFTVEAWLDGEGFKGRRPLIAKTENSEWGLYVSQGHPSFSVHLDGRYANVTAKETLEAGRWHHVAGTFDGEELRLYLDGRLVAREPARGRRTANALPLYIGADPNRRGEPVDAFKGRLDEVRISSVARYQGDAFEPARRFERDAGTLLLLHLDAMIGPWTPDDSGRNRHPTRVGNARCLPEGRPAQR